jgi:hypothetical protein
MYWEQTLEVCHQSPSLFLEQKDKERKKSAGKIEGRKRKILVLGSSHGREIGLLLQENLGTKFDVVCIYKPNAPLPKFVESLGKLGKDFSKEDHIVILGGPGNSLDRNYHYLIEEDVNSITERTSNTNVGFVNLFKRHDKPWMNGKVRSVNLWRDQALMGHGMSHIGILDTATISRKEYTAYGLQL